MQEVRLFLPVRALSDYLSPLCRLRELNLGWASLTKEMQLYVCSRFPSSLRKLNLSGYRDDNDLGDEGAKGR